MMLSILGPNFVVGIVFNENSFAIKASPIIKYMVGWSLAHVLKYIHNRGWQYEVVHEAGQEPKP